MPPFDIETFLKETTHAIWDEKDVGRIDEAYTHNAQIHVGGQLIYSRESWMSEVLQWQAAFPDLRLFVEDLIWQAHHAEGFRASMRCVLVGTHGGDGRWGLASGQRIAQTLIVHQQIWQGRIVEEYREANEIGLLNQLGVVDFSSGNPALAEFSQEAALVPQGKIDRLAELPPQKITQPQTFEIEAFVRQAIQELWNERRVGKAQDYVAAHYRGHGSSQGELYGLEDLQKEMLAFLAAFPDLRTHLDEIFWMEPAPEEFRVATRWTILGTHEGAGRFGAPTGKRVQITGLSHYRVCKGQFVEGWVEYSEGFLHRTLGLPFRKEQIPEVTKMVPALD